MSACRQRRQRQLDDLLLAAQRAGDVRVQRLGQPTRLFRSAAAERGDLLRAGAVFWRHRREITACARGAPMTDLPTPR